MTKLQQADDTDRSIFLSGEFGELATGSILTMVLPTLLWCDSIAQLWPLYTLAGELVLGFVAGRIIYWLSSYNSITKLDLKRSSQVTKLAAYRNRGRFAVPH